jgi:pyrimidine-nucleoside phosphorylase
MPALIRRKRDGGVLSKPEIRWIVSAYTAGEVPDYQMSALLMAIVWRGMTDDETTELTAAMIDSGETLSYGEIGKTADKHSTGGVGDKVSIVLAPLAAAAGLHVPMLSGRGLGHTGGTLDKLEAIPGFTTRLSAARFREVLRRVGCVMGGQSAELAPADGKIYALRDASGTVESIPLIVSSILSKKIAAGPEVIVLDVKVGRGAFMKTREDAEELARGLVRIGTRFGRRILAVVTDMDAPLGRAIGNAIEVDESVAMLRGEPVADDLQEIVLLLTSAMVVLSGVEPSLASARARLSELLSNGRAYEVFTRMVLEQGGDVVALERGLPRAPAVIGIRATEAGIVSDLDPMALATLVVDLGGGRKLVSDGIDPGVGIWIDRQLGEAVQHGDRLLTLRVPQAGSGREWEERARAAVRVRSTPPAARRLVHALVGPTRTIEWHGWDTPLPLD